MVAFSSITYNINVNKGYVKQVSQDNNIKAFQKVLSFFFLPVFVHRGCPCLLAASPSSLVWYFSSSFRSPSRRMRLAGRDSSGGAAQGLLLLLTCNLLVNDLLLDSLIQSRQREERPKGILVKSNDVRREEKTW